MEYKMNIRQLDELYCDIDCFIAQCTKNERMLYREALSSVKALILKKIREARM